MSETKEEERWRWGFGGCRGGRTMEDIFILLNVIFDTKGKLEGVFSYGILKIRLHMLNACKYEDFD